MTDSSRDDTRTVAVVGPGRAGSAIGIALVARGWQVTRVAGRAPDAEAVVAAARRFGAEPVATPAVGAGASLVVIATPDSAISEVAVDAAGGLEPGTLVIHLSGALGVEALAALAELRPDVLIGALHPLQTLPSPEVGEARLAGAWAAVVGPPAVAELAAHLDMLPFTVAADDRAAYHAAATVASNHLVALLGQVERVAATARVPLAAFEPLVRATVDNVFALGPQQALTGPVARGDVETVLRHLDAVAADEQRAYRALADAAVRLGGADAQAVRSVLE
jgi:predicted short-subunit dehydrogenase-like oxidoreductase (DUF2520 family)